MQHNFVPQCKQWLLPAYYYATWPLRQAASWVATATGNQPLMAVYYHRIADDEQSPWTMSFADFARQVDWLTRHFEMISLRELQSRVVSGRNRRPAVCLTFDDGYADNCERALPLLIERGVPCTYFVATDFVRTRRPFPHDVLCGASAEPNTVTQLREMAAAGIEVGAHTRSHADLGAVRDLELVRAEIVGSKEDLEGWLGQRVESFAFPFGQRHHLSPQSFHVAWQAGFRNACSAYGGYNLPGDDSFHVQRLHADSHFPRFRNWLKLDPRVWSGVRRYDYGHLDGVAPS